MFNQFCRIFFGFTIFYLGSLISPDKTEKVTYSEKISSHFAYFSQNSEDCLLSPSNGKIPLLPHEGKKDDKEENKKENEEEETENEKNVRKKLPFQSYFGSATYHFALKHILHQFSFALSKDIVVYYHPGQLFLLFKNLRN